MVNFPSSLTEALGPITILFNVKHVVVAMPALMVYDYLISLDQEIRLIWPSQLNLIKTLYFMNRLIPIAGAITICYVFTLIPGELAHGDNCRNGYIAGGSLIVLTYPLTSAILYARALTVWDFSKPVMCTIIWVVSALYGVMFYYAAVMFKATNVVNLRVFPRGCLVQLTKEVEWIIYLIVLICETGPTVLLIAKARQYRYSSIMQIILKDGLMYYALILLCSIINMIILLTANEAIKPVMIVPQSTLHSLLSCRLLLHLREVAAPRSVIWQDISVPRYP